MVVSRMLDVRQLAEVLSISTRTVYRRMRDKGFVPGVMVGNSLRFSSVDIVAYVERQKKKRRK
jgi:excisionase family DNA binding protein